MQSTGYENGYEGYGKIIVLNLPGPYTALYAHLSTVGSGTVSAFARAQLIGQAGCTGSCSGTHLHFEVRRSGVPIDPMLFLG